MGRLFLPGILPGYNDRGTNGGIAEKQQEVMNWILTNAGDREFTSPELAQAIDMDTSNMRSKYLMPMVWKGLLEDVKRGGRKYFKLHQMFKAILER